MTIIDYNIFVVVVVVQICKFNWNIQIHKLDEKKKKITHPAIKSALLFLYVAPSIFYVACGFIALFSHSFSCRGASFPGIFVSSIFTETAVCDSATTTTTTTML